MSPGLRKALRWGGAGLALGGIVFVALRLRDYGESLDWTALDAKTWVAVALLAAAYGLANVLLAWGWGMLLMRSGVRIPLRQSIVMYGISQLARYVPGNVAHLAGRQAIGMGAGLPAAALARSIAWELGLCAVAGAVYGWLALPLLTSAFPLPPAWMLFVATAALAAYVLARFAGRTTAAAFGLQFVFLAISASIFVVLLILAGGTAITASAWPFIGGAYVVAWLAGFVTPGAPAGIGVREMVLVLLLGSSIAEADLLAAVLLARVVTVLGDSLFFAVALALAALTADTGIRHGRSR